MVQPPNLTLWLTDYVRLGAETAGIDVEVDSQEPAELELPLTVPLIVIRDDSGPRLSHVTFDRSIGASVIGGSRSAPKPIDDLASWLAGLLFDDAIALVEGSPIASVEWDGCNGPYAVPESLDAARRYITAQYTVVGTW
ncbi:hypothetical protein [Microbacterium sp. PAMC21962]|uniref:hypothetical protein n=1 Tax=Microbacterium sp. PAMC21962 TaxID=2861280 RepID=UPI0021590F45|nr:hypothetical protein [Microbacterium sp. PAMC21962]